MTDEYVMLSGRVPDELKRLVDADERNNQEVLRAALWREFGGERKAAIDRRVEEKKTRINNLERQRNERDREIERISEELDALQQKRKAVEAKQETRKKKLQEAIDKLEDAPRDPENPGVKTQAEKLGMDPEELLAELPDRDTDFGYGGSDR